MKYERFSARQSFLYIVVAISIVVAWLGDLIHRPPEEAAVAFALLGGLVALIYFSTRNTYIEIENLKDLVSSGYRSFGKDRVNIFDIVYIGRTPNFPLNQYGSRMIFYVKTSDGKLAQFSQRELNFSNETIIAFLKRIKQLNPRTKLDLEYEKILNGDLLTSDPSKNSIGQVDSKALQSLSESN